MKVYQLFLIFSIISFCFLEDADQCTTDFENILKDKCEGINSCSFTLFSDHSVRCISTKNEGCQRANGDSDLCAKIFPSTFPKQRCQIQSGGTNCIPENNNCLNFNSPVNGILFDPIKDRAICDGFYAASGKRCLVVDRDLSTIIQCKEFYTRCEDITDPDECEANLIDYTTKCHFDGSCKSGYVRYCDTGLDTVTEEECSNLQSSNADKKCVYSGGRCSARYVNCEKYGSSSTCNDNSPLIQKENAYYLDDSKLCQLVPTDSGTDKCDTVYKYCESYTGSDSTMCEKLRVTDSTNKRCVYDPTSTGDICREVYKTCQLFNDKTVGKWRSGDCEKNILSDPNKKCIYIEEIDKCIETDLYSSCEEYKGSDKYICESIRSPTTNAKCILEKDRTCKERIFNCTEAFDEEDCLYYAKPVDNRKICVYNGGKCHEVYKNCEDYLQMDTTTTCSSLTLYNGNKCYEETISNTKRCRSKTKTCNMAQTNKDECILIAESGVSDPDKKVCDFIKYSTESDPTCKENYKYCSDYRGSVTDICEKIKPYDESGKSVDITSKCQMGNYGCERISKECGESDVLHNPILCSLISEKIQDNNVQYCAFIGNDCVKHYKTCESYTGGVLSVCRSIIPQNYLTSGFCDLEDGHCVTKKKECNTFDVTNYKYLCENMPNCTYSGGVCFKKSTPESCKDVTFYIASDENEEICKNLATESPNTICSLRESKAGCEEILNKTILEPTTTSKENSSFLTANAIHFIMIFLYLLF